MLTTPLVKAKPKTPEAQSTQTICQQMFVLAVSKDSNTVSFSQNKTELPSGLLTVLGTISRTPLWGWPTQTHQSIWGSPLFLQVGQKGAANFHIPDSQTAHQITCTHNCPQLVHEVSCACSSLWHLFTQLLQLLPIDG